MNNELRTGRFFTADCAECGEVVGNPGDHVMPCDFTENGTCKCCGNVVCGDCFREIWKECPDCGRRGCREHFDGMYCFECIKENNK